MKYKMVLTLLLLIVNAVGGELPDAPHLKMRPSQPTETYSADERMIVHNTPSNNRIRSERIFDLSFFTGIGIYAGSSAFDRYETQNNLFTCAFEGNPDLGLTPSDKAQAIHGLVEFGGVFAGTVFLKWVGHKNNIPHWATVAASSIPAAIGTGKHIHGGMEWVHLCN